MITSATFADISSTYVAIITMEVVQTITATTDATVDGAVGAVFDTAAGQVATIITAAGNAMVGSSAGATTKELAVLGTTDQARGTLCIRITVSLTVEARTIRLTEVVVAQNTTHTTSAGISRGHTNIPKAVIQIAAIGNT
jgi:hypothetical protein